MLICPELKGRGRAMEECKEQDMNGKEYDEWKSYTTSTVRVNQPKAKEKHYCWCMEYCVFLISSAQIM